MCYRRQPKADRGMIRVGLLIDAWTVPAWVHKVVSDIQSSSIAKVVLVVKNETAPEPPKPLWRKIWSRQRELVYLVYKKLDDWKNRVEPDAFKSLSLEPLVRDCLVISVTPVKEKHRDYFRDEDVQTILRHDLDVTLRFGFNILMGKALEIARHGVWSYHHGDNRTHRGGPAGLWEVLEGTPVTGSMLQILTPELDNGKILYRSWAATDPFSARKNRNNYYWKSSAFVMRKLKNLTERGEKNLVVESPNSIYKPYSGRLYKTPRNQEMARLLAGLVGRYARHKIQNLFSREQWFVAFRIQENQSGPDEAFHRFKPLFPPKERFWADPFPVERDGRYFVFIEEYLEKKKKGHISVIEIDREGNGSLPVKVLERDYHLAYPFVFEWKDEFFMIPETSSNRTVELYRSVKFPHEWTLEKVLMADVNAVDATLAELEGRWWLFVNLAETEGNVKNWDELFLFYSESPLGSWKPHAANPVKSDVRSARPAGRIFSRQGHFYRPSQDCSGRYGHALCLNEIQRISPTEYEEREVSRIFPRWREGLLANHTLNCAGGLTVIDGLFRRTR